MDGNTHINEFLYLRNTILYQSITLVSINIHTPLRSLIPFLLIFPAYHAYFSTIYKVNKMANQLKEVMHGINASQFYRLILL